MQTDPVCKVSDDILKFIKIDLPKVTILPQLLVQEMECATPIPENINIDS